MNILDFKGFAVASLTEILEKQKEIMVAFEPNLKQRIEEFDIDIYEDQMLLKDFLLVRAGEEITEAAIAIQNDHYEHYKEELVDVFNFLIEASLLLNWNEYAQVNCQTGLLDPYFTSDHFEKELEARHAQNEYVVGGETQHYWHLMTDIKPVLFELYTDIGRFTNKLKLRPWRNSQYPIDLLTAKQDWRRLWLTFWQVLITSEITWKEFCLVWSKKYEVNKFRIDSNY